MSGTWHEGAAARPGFVGRAREFAGLLDLLSTAANGTSGFALISGEPGIGKTRLLDELGAVATSRGWHVLSGRASNADGVPAFWPWRQVMRQWLNVRDRPDGPDPVDEHGPLLSRIIPELAGDTPPATQNLSPDSAQDRFAAFERFGRLLADAAAGTGLLLLLDDLHWADDGSLSLLTGIVRDIRDCRLVVVGAFRPVELAGRAGGAELRTLVGRHRNGVVVHLAGLSADDVDAQLKSLLDRRPTPEVVAAVRERTQGNPLFVQEISRLLDAGLPPDEHLPALIRDVIRHHLDCLSPESRETLRTAAFLGAAIEPDVLATVAERPVLNVLMHLDEATRGGVLTAEHAFRHDLFRETLRDETPGPARAQAHLRIAVALETGGPPRPLEVARHRLAALPLGDATVASTAAHAAGHAALTNLAFEDAADLFDAAAAAAPADLPTAARCEYLIDAGKARFLVRDIDGALARCSAAAELAQRAGDPESLGHAALALPEFPEPRWTSLVSGWCEQALAQLPEEDSSLRAQLLAQRALANMLTSGPARMADESATALAMARRVADSAATLLALRARQLACASPDGRGERFELGSEMLQLGKRDGDAEAMLWGHLWRYDALVQAGRIDDAWLELAQLDAVATRLGRPLARWHALRSRVAIEIGRGRFADATRHAHQQAEYVPDGLSSGSAIVATMLIAQLTGDNQGVLADTRPADFQHPLTAFAEFIAVAPWRLAFGQVADATELYRALPEASRQPHFVSMMINAVRCQVAVGLNDAKGAAAAYEALLPYADLHAVPGAGITVTLGSVHLYLGLAAAAIGKGDDAARHFAAAAESNNAAGLHPYAALARFHLAETLHAYGNTGDLGRARREAEAAAEAAQQLGMAPLLAQATALRDRLAEHRPANPLTRRQRQLAALLAQGYSNKEMAAALHLSERTVESHVHNIMTTLGVASRVEVATWVARREG